MYWQRAIGYWLLTSLLLLLSSRVLAQRVVQISSHVSHQENQQALALGNVTLYRLIPDTMLVAFTTTNATGAYTIQANLHIGLYKLTIRALDIMTTDTVFTITENSVIIQLDRHVITKAIELREVRVKATVPVKANNDTTTYAIKAFTNGTERSVEDVLKKLPGIEVSEDGKIKVNGKAVDKVLIEGENLFSKKYQLITRNLGADVLSNVQAIDNFSENTLLYDIEKTGRLVLNLKIRDDLKVKVFGSVGVSGGIGKRYEANMSLFSLAKKIKMGLIGNGNNTGNDPVVNAQYELESEEENSAFLEPLPSNPIVNNQFSTIPDIATSRYNFNQSGLLGITASSKLSEKVKLRAFSYFSHDRQSFRATNNLLYLLDSSTIKLYDSTYNVRTPAIWAGNLHLTYIINSKTHLTISSDSKRTIISNRS